jgi:hypothetical protein
MYRQQLNVSTGFCLLHYVIWQRRMSSDWATFFSANASAIFALAGALGAGALSAVTAFIVKRREFDLSLTAKLFERRIAVHEKVIEIATEMRVMVALGGRMADGEVRRAPHVMMSREYFDDWLASFTQRSLGGTSWLSTKAKRELNFVQDYLLTLHMHLAGVPDERYPDLGVLIQQDFIDLSSSLEKQVFEFFRTGVRQLRLDSLDEWHKYELKETERRLGETALGKNFERFAQSRSDNAR